jgi:hypothetical protein
MTPPFLAQSSVSVDAQLSFVLDSLTTLPGISAAVLGISVVAISIALKKVVPVMSGLAMYFVTFQLNPTLQSNTLIPILQSTRLAAKSIAFALLVLTIAFVPALPRSGRRTTVGAAAIGLLGFQLFYAIQLSLFAGDGLMKGVFGVIAISLMFGVCAWGFGRQANDAASARAALATLSWAGIGFIASNFLQIIVDPGGALMALRLAGTAGNAQMMGGTATILLLAASYQFASRSSSEAAKWINLAMICVLGSMVLATGSRTAAMATVVGVAVFFRSEIGKFILLAVVLALGFVLLSVTVESSARLTFDRFSEGQDTRGAVWSEALAIFYASPIFGEFPFLQPGQEPNGIESTFIRTLANMGLVGATVLAVPLLFIFRDLLRVIQLSRSSPEYRRLCDFYLSSCASLLVLNIFDGYAFGFMTLPVMFMYLVLSVGSLIVDQPDGTETDIAAEES